LRIAKADGAGVELFRLAFRPEQATEQGVVSPFSELAEAMADGALEAGAGKERVLGVAFALDRAVDQAKGSAGAHVHGADGVEEKGGLGLVHGGSGIS